MIILVSSWKQKVLKALTVLVLILAFAFAIPVFTGVLYRQIPAFTGWFQEEHPTGNPMRVEKQQDDTKFNQVVNQFVIKLQDFYYEK